MECFVKIVLAHLDRGEKFQRYLELDSLEEYVLVSQDTQRIESFFRQTDGTWLFTPVTGDSRSIRLRALNVELEFAEIYAGVKFPSSNEMG